MCQMKISIKDKNNVVICQISGQEQVSLIYDGEYAAGDKICFSAPSDCKHLIIEADATLGESLVYLQESLLEFPIPFGDKADSYAPDAFKGFSHVIKMRAAKPEEILSYKNLALNKIDYPGSNICYPHASSNNETRGEYVFAARNAIDGLKDSSGHGIWPYTSWGPDINDDAELMLEFGRLVEIDKINLYIRTDFPHDSYWDAVTILFSDGTSQIMHLSKISGPQCITFEKKKVEWLKLTDLKKVDEPAEFPALTQIEAFGRDIGF